MNPNDGGPAYPIPSDGATYATHPGMSLRDHFAGLALSGMLAREYLGPAEATMDAYDYADAMLIARARENGA